MPRIRHWFHVTHDINGDPEMWELRDKFGDRAGFVWMEILSISDRNDGLVGHNLDQLRNQLASKCRTSRVKVDAIINWCRDRSWLLPDRVPMPSQPQPDANPTATRLEPGSSRDDIELVSRDGLRTRSHAEYHPSRDAKKNGGASPPPSPPIPSLPKSKNKSNPPPTEAVMCAQLLSDKIFENFPNRTAPTEAQLMSWAWDAEKINRLDNHSWAEICELIEWAHADSFWRANILSMSKLREKWNQLTAKKESSDERHREAAEPKGNAGLRDFLRHQDER